MSQIQYIRARDGMSVAASEACDASGAVRNGYSIRSSKWLAPGDHLSFDIALTDAAPPGRANFTDAERTFADSAEGSAAIARARATFDMGQAYKPASDRVQWTDHMMANVVRQTVAQRQASASYVADMQARLPVLQQEAAEARQKMIADMNGWRRRAG